MSVEVIPDIPLHESWAYQSEWWDSRALELLIGRTLFHHLVMSSVPSDLIFYLVVIDCFGQQYVFLHSVWPVRSLWYSLEYARIGRQCLIDGKFNPSDSKKLFPEAIDVMKQWEKITWHCIFLASLPFCLSKMCRKVTHIAIRGVSSFSTHPSMGGP